MTLQELAERCTNSPGLHAYSGVTTELYEARTYGHPVFLVENRAVTSHMLQTPEPYSAEELDRLLCLLRDPLVCLAIATGSAIGPLA